MSAILTLLHRSETWTLKEEDKPRITVAKMKALRNTAKHLLVEHKTNQDVLKESVLGKISKYNNKRTHDICRVDRSRLQKSFINGQETGNKDTY